MADDRDCTTSEESEADDDVAGVYSGPSSSRRSTVINTNHRNQQNNEAASTRTCNWLDQTDQDVSTTSEATSSAVVPSAHPRSILSTITNPSRIDKKGTYGINRHVRVNPKLPPGYTRTQDSEKWRTLAHNSDQALEDFACIWAEYQQLKPWIEEYKKRTVWCWKMRRRRRWCSCMHVLRTGVSMIVVRGQTLASKMLVTEQGRLWQSEWFSERCTRHYWLGSDMWIDSTDGYWRGERGRGYLYHELSVRGMSIAGHHC